MCTSTFNVKTWKQPVCPSTEKTDKEDVAHVYQVGAKITVVSDAEFKIITINTFLPMRNKLVYSYSIKICSSGFNLEIILEMLLESIFCLLLVVEAFSLQKIVEMLQEVVIGW